MKRQNSSLKSAAPRKNKGSPGLCSIYACDRFGGLMGFSVGDSMYRFSSGWGACFSILCLVGTILYAVEKIFVQS